MTGITQTCSFQSAAIRQIQTINRLAVTFYLIPATLHVSYGHCVAYTQNFADFIRCQLSCNTLYILFAENFAGRSSGTDATDYFDDRVGACQAAGLFAALSVAGSVGSLALGPDVWGAGFLVAGAVTGFWVLQRLRRYLSQLEYHVFCEQPLFAKPQYGVLCRAEERLVRADRAYAQRRHPREKNRE